MSKLHLLPVSIVVCAGLAAAALPGCRTAPIDPTRELAEQRHVTLPEQWSAAPESAPLEPGVESDPWWHTFGDERLVLAIDEALRNNHDLAAAAARVEQATALAVIAGADRRPSVSFGLNGQRSGQVFVGLPVPGPGGPLKSTSTSFRGSLDVSWEADLWGRLAAQKDAAGADLRASEQDLRAARHSIAARTAGAWFQWQAARVQQRLATDTVTNYRSTAELLRDRYDLGLVPLLDVHQAESNLASAEALREARGDEVARAARQVELLLGRYPAGALEGDAELRELTSTPPAGLPSELLARRPDLVAAEARVVAVDRRLEQARGRLLPSLTLTASGGRASDELSDLFDSDFDVWSLFAGLTAPLFQGGRLRAGVELEEARVRESLAVFASAVLQAFVEVEDALDSEARLARRESHLRVAASEAASARDLAEERYESGLSDLLTVLGTQQRALDSESALIDVRRQRLTNRALLHLALGGGFGEAE